MGQWHNNNVFVFKHHVGIVVSDQRDRIQHQRFGHVQHQHRNPGWRASQDDNLLCQHAYQCPRYSGHLLEPGEPPLLSEVDSESSVVVRGKAAAARALLGVGSTSEAIDVALDQLIHAERLRADIAAYQRTPPTVDEVELASFGDPGGIGDDTDWEALYGDGAS